MQLSVEILDRVFGFLVWHRETLYACSKDPILSPIVERHLYYDVVVQIAGTPNRNTFGSDQLSRLVSENPRILYYVRILQIQVESPDTQVVREQLDKFAETLLKFPVLECLVLAPETNGWYWTDIFRAALEDRLKLPTLTEVHFVVSKDFPPFLLDKCKNVKDLSFSGPALFEVVEGGDSDPTLPQLKTLTLQTPRISSSFRAWLKRHVSGLQSLTCVMLPAEVLPELLGACSETLNRLELSLLYQPEYYSTHTFRTGQSRIKHFPEIPLIPKNLQQLIIYAFADMDDNVPKGYRSCLPAVAEAVNSFIPSLRHLVLDVTIALTSFSNFTKFDFSPLAVLGIIPRTDLYVHTGIAPAAVTRAQLMSLLGDDQGIMGSIEEGRLVIHSEKAFEED